MADIRFQILNQSNGQPSLDTLSGSGLAFYGASVGSSVQIGAYNENTNVANADGTTYKNSTTNIKYYGAGDTFPSGICVVDETGGANYTVGLSGIRTMHATLGIEFGHTSAVNVQNCQLRIYDRGNINYPASGVNTKVAEIINHNGSTFSAQGQDGDSAVAVGSGDMFWWGEPWPSEFVTKNYYTNSSGQVFYNGTSDETRTNGDSRLSAVDDPGSYATVGGTGVIVPLINSPGSGQKQASTLEIVDTGANIPGLMWPKWTQYVASASQTALFKGSNANQFGNGTDPNFIGRTYGGTGIDTHHTWAVALSASPLSIGSKEQYGLYVSLEYL